MLKKYFQKKNFKVFLFFIFFGILILPCLSFSQEQNTNEKPQDIRMIVGDVQTIETVGLTRVSIVNPGVADVLDAQPSEISILAKRPGRTEIFTWDEDGKRVVRVWVFQEMLDIVEMRLSEFLRILGIDNLKLEKNEMEGKIVISGELEKNKLKEYQSVIQPFQESLLDFVREKPGAELIEVEVQIFEVTASFAQTIGITWANMSTEGTGGTGTHIFKEQGLPGPLSDIEDLFKIGKFARSTLLTATIDALIEQGKARVLSRPKIVVRSGENASFSVGGQIPVKTTTFAGGDVFTENFIFRDYGVSVNVKPTVELDRKIDIDLDIEVSDIDADAAVGDTVGYTRRAAKTKLYLDEGQTIVLAGFIKDNRGETIKRVPFLGSIPIVGALFRSRQISPDRQVELFITLTPRILVSEQDKIANIRPEAQAVTPFLTSAEEEEKPKPAVKPYVEEKAQPAPVAAAPIKQEVSAPRPRPAVQETAQVAPDPAPRVAMQQTVQPTPVPVPAPVVEEKTETLSTPPARVVRRKETPEPVARPAQQPFPPPRPAPVEIEEAPKELPPVAIEEILKEEIFEFEEDIVIEEEIVELPRIVRYDYEPEETFELPFSMQQAEEQTMAMLYSIEQQERASRTASPVYESTAVPANMAQYARSVQEKIARAVYYPASSRQAREQGAVHLELSLHRSGMLISALVSQSSGYSNLDQAALETARENSPYSRFPEELVLENLTITIPIVYQLE